jgi:hypothetical protein
MRIPLTIFPILLLFGCSNSSVYSQKYAVNIGQSMTQVNSIMNATPSSIEIYSVGNKNYENACYSDHSYGFLIPGVRRVDRVCFVFSDSRVVATPAFSKETQHHAENGISY